MNPTNTTWCKVCGVTTLADAMASALAGVDALGFNFYPSSARFLAPAKAADICTQLKITHPRVQKIGLFVDAPAAEVIATLAAVDLDLLQFHGDESAEYCRQFDMPYIKVLGMAADADFTNFAANYADAWALLLDTFDAQMKGGTGRQFDWTLWPEQSASRLVLAGGLTPDNVAQSVRQLRPFGVDVAGGVENERKGVKDHAKVKHFIENAKNG